MPVFGVALSDLELAQNRVPPLINSCIRIIRSSGIPLEGIFRISGNAQDVADLKARVDSGTELDFVKWKVQPHEAASLLKQFFRELPQPVLTFERYQRWVDVACLPPGSQMLASLKALFLELPEPNRDLLRVLLPFLALVSDNNEFNKMPAANLAKVIGPNLLWAQHESGDPMMFLQMSNKVNDLVEQMLVNWRAFMPEAADPTPVFAVAKMFGHTKTCQGLAAADENSVWSFDSGGKIRIWSVTNYKFLSEFDSGLGRLFVMKSFQNGQVWTTSAYGTKVWDASSRKEMKHIPGFAYAVHRVGTHIWLGGEQTIHIYDQSTLNLVTSVNGGLTNGCVLTCMVSTTSAGSKGDEVWAGSVDPILRVFDAKTASLLVELPGHSRKISTLAMVKNFVWTAENKVLVWNVDTRSKVASLDGHEGTVHCIASFGDNFAWTSAWDGVIIIWDASSLTPFFRIEGYASDAIAWVESITNPATGRVEAWAASWDQSVLVFLVSDDHQPGTNIELLEPLSSDGTAADRKASIAVRRAQLDAARLKLDAKEARLSQQRAKLEAMMLANGQQ